MQCAKLKITRHFSLFLHSLFSNSYLSNSSSSNTSSGVYSSLSDSSSLSHHHLSITTKCEATLTSSSSQDPATNDLLKSKIPVGIAVGRQRPQVANSSTALASSSVAKTSALDAKSDKQSCAQVLPITSTLTEIDIYLKDVWDEYHLQFACRQSGFISNPI